MLKEKKWLLIIIIVIAVLIALGLSVGWKLAGIIASFILAAGAFVVFYQIRQARLSTNAEVALEMFKELRDEETIDKIRDIYRLNLVLYQDFTQYYKNIVDYILDRLDTLGALNKNGIIDDTLAIEAYGGPAILRCWYQLARYIRVAQKNRGFYADNYEMLTYRTYKYFKDRGIRVAFVNRFKPVPIKDLISEFEEDYFKKELREEFDNIPLFPRNEEKIKEYRNKYRKAG